MSGGSAIPWSSEREQRSIAFSTGMRLGALAAIAGCASAALRGARGSAGGAPMDRLLVLVISAFAATIVWGLGAGLWLSSAASRRFRALEATVRQSGERVARWCPASVRDGSGAVVRGALARTEEGQWIVILQGEATRVLGDTAPVVGARGLGWGAALMGAPCEPLEFNGQIVYVDRALAVVREESVR
ncbi:MAG: hypothetical protein U0269_36520 [Polyangiales bacterium]